MGRGDHSPARARVDHRLVGDRVERGGVRGVDPRGALVLRDHCLGATPGAPLPAHDRRGGHLRPVRADRQAQAQPRAGGRYERLEDARRARISLVESTRARASGVASFHAHLAGSRPPAARDHLHFLARGLRGRRAPSAAHTYHADDALGGGRDRTLRRRGHRPDRPRGCRRARC